MVRSKSELVIANIKQMGLRVNRNYQYEPRYEGTRAGVCGGFSFRGPRRNSHMGASGNAVSGRLESWQRKKRWYELNGFVLNDNLFTTEDDERGGLDSQKVRTIAERICEII
jgi:hypothetical protein